MKLGQSLRTSLAAYLALTVLSMPLAGCDFFDDENKPSATTGKKNEAKLPKGTIAFTLPRPNDERRVVEALGMDALRYYVYARIATEKLSRMNEKNAKPKDYEKLLRETAKLWQCAELYAKAAGKLSAELAKKEKKAGYKPLAALDEPILENPFFSVAHAALADPSNNEISRPHWYYPQIKTNGNQNDKAPSKEEWANAMKKTYEQFPAGQRINELAKKLNVDVKTANEKFQEAERILSQGSKTASTVYNVGTKTALVVKGACQTGLLVGGMILTGGSTGPAAVAGAINTVAATADWVIEIANIGHEVFTGETNQTLDEIKKYTGTISAVTSGATIVTSFSDFALKGDKAVKITQETLKNAGLKNIAGFLDKYKIGGAGVAAITDSSIWVTERGMELSEGKILGFQVFMTKDGKTVMIPAEIPADKFRQPMDISKISMPQLLEMTPAELAARMETINELIKILSNPSQDILDEDARRRKEIEDEEARRLEEARKNAKNVGNVTGQVDMYAKVQEIQRNRGRANQQNQQNQNSQQSRNNRSAKEDLPYEASKLAGYYTITSPTGDVAMRAIIKATGDKTIRALQVQKKTDKKGTALFSAEIDPKSGQGKTDQGAVIRFSRNASGAYTGAMDDGYKSWRLTKQQ